MSRAPRVAQLVGPDGIREVPVDEVRPGDALLVRSGEVVPVDGRVEGDPALLDESALTGEPLPVTHQTGDPVRSGVANDISLDAAAATDPTYGLIFRGLFEAKAKGIYTFHLTSNDGSAFYIDGQKIADNDGDHRTITKSGQVALEVGFHPIAVRYFQAGGEKALALQYQGPGIPKQPVPASALFQDAAGDLQADSIDQ